MGRTVYRFSAEKDADQILLWLSGCCPDCVKGMGVFIDGKSLSHSFISDSFDIAFD